MDSPALDSLLAWIGQNPLAAGLVIFAVAFVDALLLVGFLIPAMALLFGVGTLVGLGLIDPWYAIACASAGAFAGDLLSFVIGRSAGPRLRNLWPFSRYPHWLVRGEVFFHRHGLKGIVIARYVGAVRPLVPAIAGMLHMPLRRFLPPSAFAGATWGFATIAPGWLFGAWLDLLSAVAGRLALVVGILLVLLGLMALSVFALYRVLAPRAAMLVEHALAWSHRHPVLGRYSVALIDPKRRESPSLALLALGLLFAGWAFFSLLLAQIGGSGTSGFDLRLHEAFIALRNPLADAPLAVISVLGEWPVLATAFGAVAGWLLWRRRTVAAVHWLVAAAVGLALVLSLGWLLDVPRPPEALKAPGFSFPSIPVTMATVIYGFFAVLVARELPGRRRSWPYVVAGLLIACVAFSRLYLGAHWFSDILGGVLLGLAWIAGLGIAYRRRVARSFWVAPVSLVFFVAIGASAAWFGPRQAADTLARFDPPQLRLPVTMQAWWNGEARMRLAPGPRSAGALARRLNIEYAGDPRRLADRLAEAGWESRPQAGWDGLLMTLANDASPGLLPVLPSAYQGRAETLLLVHRHDDGGDMLSVLRLWPATLSIEPGAMPVWVGKVHTLRFNARLDLVSFWEDIGDDEAALAELRGAADALGLGTRPGEDGDLDGTVHPTLRLREIDVAAP